MKPAIFFDRDGVLNHDLGYVHKPSDFKWIDGAIEAIKFLNHNGYLVIIVTNQSGLARGYFSKEDLNNLHNWMNGVLLKKGARVDKIYYCPHHPDGLVENYSIKCSCRKPEPGMIFQAINDLKVEASASFLIGDKESDLQAAQSAGIKGYLFEGGDLFNFLKEILI